MSTESGKADVSPPGRGYAQGPVRRAILLLAGRGRRLGPLTEEMPKCMVEVDGVPILERALEALGDCGVREVVLVVGYRADQVRRFTRDRFDGLTLRYVVNERHSETNTAYSLWLAREYLDTDLLLLEGDIVFDHTAIRRILETAGAASAWAAVPVGPGRDEGILLARSRGERVRRVDLVRPPDTRPPELSHKCGGIQLLKAPTAVAFARALDGAVADGGARVYADLVLGELLTDHEMRLCSLQDVRWAEVDDPDDLERAREVFAPEAPVSGQRAGVEG